MNLPSLEHLDVLARVEQIGMPKYGAHFLSSQFTEQDQTYYFECALNKNYPFAFEVRRSKFDHLLLKKQRQLGRRGTRRHARD